MPDVTYTFTKDHSPAQLHDAFKAAGAVIRSFAASALNFETGIAASGSVVHDGTLSVAQMDTVKNAHTPVAPNAKKIKDAAAAMIADLDAGIAITTAGNPTAAQIRAILDGLMKNQKKIVQYLSDQVIS